MVSALGFHRPWHLPQIVIPAEIGALDDQHARRAFADRHRGLLDTIEWNFQHDLESAARANVVGRIEWLSDRACRFYYFDTERSRTLTRIRTRTVKHTHDLIHAKKVRLPAPNVRKPRTCCQIIRAMPPWVQKRSSIVVGDQIVADVEQVGQTDEPNELVLAARWIGRKLEQGRQTAYRAAAKVMQAASKLTETTTDILRDPALVIGDYVLAGWEG
jgi:hypothetical protein